MKASGPSDDDGNVIPTRRAWVIAFIALIVAGTSILICGVLNLWIDDVPRPLAWFQVVAGALCLGVSIMYGRLLRRDR